MLGLAIVKSEKRLKEWIDENVDKNDYSCMFNIFSLYEILEGIIGWKEYLSSRDDKIFLENFFSSCDVGLNIRKESPLDKILVLTVFNDEGDGKFLSENGCLDYDIDIDFFPENQQNIYNALINGLPFLKNTKVVFGAARNG